MAKKEKPSEKVARREIGRRVREYRLAAGLNQKDLGDVLGLHHSTYKRHEDWGTFQPDRLAKIARALGVTVEALTGEHEAPNFASTVRTVIVYRMGTDMQKVVGNYAPTSAVSPKAYALEVVDDAMRAPGSRSIEKGDWCVVDPSRPAIQGSIVHAVDPHSGVDVVRIFIPLHPTNPMAPGFTLRATDPSYDDIVVTGPPRLKAIKGVVIEKRTLLG